MGWASPFIAKLKEGETVTFRPKGNSMSGRVESGQQVTVIPLTQERLKELKPGDIVLCTVKGYQYLHLVKGVRRTGETPVSFQIGNNRGGVQGWVSADKLHGLCIKIED